MNPQARFQRMVGERIRFARDQVGLTQRELSDRLGFKDRQILANIEDGKRKVAADELVTVIDILKKPLEFFTDPFLLVGEGAFSWRADASLRTLDAFEEKSRGLIAAFRELCRQASSRAGPSAGVSVEADQTEHVRGDMGRRRDVVASLAFG